MDLAAAPQGMGYWLPLLLRGTFSGDENGYHSIDCVVVDITEQKSACRKSWSRKKERYRILLEQSQDIFFDVITEKRTLGCSPNFLLKFWQRSHPLFNKKAAQATGTLYTPTICPPSTS